MDLLSSRAIKSRSCCNSVLYLSSASTNRKTLARLWSLNISLSISRKVYIALGPSNSWLPKVLYLSYKCALRLGRLVASRYIRLLSTDTALFSLVLVFWQKKYDNTDLGEVFSQSDSSSTRPIIIIVLPLPGSPLIQSTCVSSSSL